MTHFYTTTPSPVGELTLIANGKAIVGLYWDISDVDSLLAGAKRDDTHPVLKQALAELKEYFAGKRTTFDVPVAFDHGTDFQRQCWEALKAIPYGKTYSYGEQAGRIGRPKAVRAVGGANGQNPISIIVPCHRVVGADGSLTGFGGGIERKAYLLNLEQGQKGLAL
ncbi:MAG: methylated-DNA--[protein]-cysteine S-methyltransferase [Proteobacteria bacterium]|nr:methylated-DNA--[protein]-cysteine S-methyltransferase [Pseudomonadota bacterium]